MAAPAKLLTMSQGFQNSKGSPVAGGSLMLTLSQSCTVTATGGIVDTAPIYLALDNNGKITNTAVWFQDELSPSGTIYRGVVYGKNGCSTISGLDQLSYSFTGAGPFDLSTAVQSATASPSYSAQVLLNPSAAQSIIGFQLNVPSLGKTGSANTLTLPGSTDTLTGKATNDTLTNKTLTGATTGNNVSVLNAQGAIAALTGNAGDQVIYTYSLPANTIDTNSKGIKISCALNHSTGTANPSVKININGVNAVTGSIGTTASQSVTVLATILRTASTTGGSMGISTSTGALNPFSAALTGLAWTSAQTITVTFNVANTDQMTGIMFLVEQIQ